ncbi:hypothetical protein EDD21DRAFT_382768 [Dissophora ornata]|nr:hypothetical protein EDD21DRAFT_382768 [Dissophora ornata]
MSFTSAHSHVGCRLCFSIEDHFPADAVEEDLMTVKRSGGLERGGLSLLRRSARTKIRRNSTASNDTRTDVSRLRQTVNANGEYPAVSLVDPGPQPRPSTLQSSASELAASEDTNKSRQDGEAQPLKRFVSTLRDPSKPTITTYVEPHLLEQQRRDNEEANKDEDGAPSFRISAPGKLENSTAARELAETTETDRKEKPENFTISYPIPPPVKLAQNLLQQPSSQQPPSPQALSKQKYPGQTGTHGTQTHAKKPSTWSWRWGKEKGGEKTSDLSVHEPGVTPPSSTGSDTNVQSSSSSEATVKKQSTFSMLFSRNGKATSSKAHATTAESTHSITANGFSGQGALSDKPKYSNYNRLPIHVERAIYRLSHVKLANPRRPLHEQVLISNMMFWYLGVIQQQQLMQQQAEMQLQQQQQAQQQKENSKGTNSKGDGKKSKPKKRKSQKKKNQQRNASKSAERIVKGPEYEMQQQQQYHVNEYVNQGAQPPQQGGASPASGNPPAVNQGRTQSSHHTEPDEESRVGGGGQEHSDSYDDSEGDEPALQQQQRQENGSLSDTLTTLSIMSAPHSAQDDEEDDDVPLGHYQNMPRQTVPGS